MGMIEPLPIAEAVIPAGTYLVGTDDGIGHPDDQEGPSRAVSVAAFAVSETAVTNAEFEAFVRATGYRTDAERYGWSFVFRGFLRGRPDAHRLPSPPEVPWWAAVPEACWCRPEGPGSSHRDRADHPVVHVSWHDALQWCAWAGRRLPSEVEWEVAARGGLVGATYPWGDELRPGGEHRCNLFQGDFPLVDTGEDGWVGTAPVRTYPPNGYGLHEVVGNVWEWCLEPFRGERVIRGGSYLCHESYCCRYRVAARSTNAADSSTGNLGFRTVRDLEEDC
jgi:sulfatase modifying factor 1